MPDSKDLLDQAFLEMRWRCLSLAADLDRLGRSQVDESDPRWVKLQAAIEVLLEDHPDRAERVQTIFSDLTPPPSYRKAVGK
jgi:hypothetical protein